ncbi:MAG: hypothetical protein FWF59_09580 [Turicibacter sp.]|nr:hypothetical protein [Turicibacter sp.]
MTYEELKERQRDRLFDLLTIKAENEGIEVKGLKKLIIRAKNGMSDEDIAVVEKNIQEIYG